ncbi:LysM domain-containing protein [Desulfosporosinus sp. Sb-LF]|uniref:LysM peptidoglycan-binding domain-containing protein n=1 Tax=Desulfosporosinus sp. Sb-LF TaxID=2560027 RepID=UPI00107F795A|nr:LysM domain-containing protein [Desulfosporosinus sp. Sb-LF]TGE31802.1 LysM peptidoglycan-binding domain-containing protein [Desulfosporosinus sp. Sb-LF]
MPRVPAACPTNYAGHYTVNPGDTMFIISSIFRINLSELVRANPHITDPNVIFSGDILCVPGQIPFPCCVTLDLVQPAELGVAGVALVYTSFVGTQAISVMAVMDALPVGFDILIAEVNLPNQVTSRQQLYPSPQTPPTFSGTTFFPTAASLTPDTIIRVFPANSATGNQGSIKLQGSLNRCHR